MCWTINHSQVNAADRRFAFCGTNWKNFDNISGIPLFSILIHSHRFLFFCFCFFPCCPLGALVALVIKLSPKFASPSTKAENGKAGRPEREREEPNYFRLFQCQVINKSLLSSHDVQPGASPSHIFFLSSIKYLGIFPLKIIQDFCLGWIIRKGKKIPNSMCMSTCTCVFQVDKCARITLALAS